MSNHATVIRNSEVFIEKTIYLDAPVTAVWPAVVEPEKFGQWFCTQLDAPFRVNEITHGYSTYPGCERLRWRAITETLDHERLLIFTWWPAPEDVPFNESDAGGMRVEIAIRATVDGTRVIFRESGFDAIYDKQKRERMIEVRKHGWNVQANNMREYLGNL